MGQAQKRRQHSARYEGSEVELWELGGGIGGSNGKRYRRSVNQGGNTGRSGNSAGNGRKTARRPRENYGTIPVLYENGAGRRNNVAAGRNSVGYGSGNTGKNRTITVIGEDSDSVSYRQRHMRQQGRANSARTGNRCRERELELQDIRKPRRGAERYGDAGNVYRGSGGSRRPQRRNRKVFFARMISLAVIAVCLVMICFMAGELLKRMRGGQETSGKDMVRTISDKVSDEVSGRGIMPPELMEDYLEINEFSRPGTALTKINSIFVHYTANPGTSAAQNRSYFANLALTQERSASAHLIIGYEGELIQCIPFDEQAYAVMTRNEDSISIECCYISEDGSFTQETYDTLVHTLAWLVDKYDLSVDDILRHYDCGGKKCPVYYVENEGAWEELLRDVAAYVDAGEEDA